MFDPDHLAPPDYYEQTDAEAAYAMAYARAIADADDRRLALAAGVKAGWY